MRTFLTMARVGKNWRMLAGPEKEYAEHKHLFHKTEKVDEIQIWASSGGVMKRRKTKTDPTPAPPAKPTKPIKPAQTPKPAKPAEESAPAEPAA